ncbi:MAG: hypothetical protein ACK40V_07070, partial [Anaerolineales bacterium]
MDKLFSKPSKSLQSLLTLIQTWFNRLTYPRKFIVITFIFSIPLIAFLPLIAQQAAEIDRYGYKAFDGTEYLRTTQNLLNAVLEHQRLANQQNAAELEQASANVETAFQGYTLLANRNNERDIEGDLAPDVQAIKKEWESFQAEMPSMNPSQRNQAYAVVISQILNLIEKAGAKSYLAVNPNFDTKYLSDTILIVLPQNTLTLYKLFFLSQQGIENGSLSSSDKEQMIIWIYQLEENLEALNKNLETTRSYNDSDAIESTLNPSYQSYETQLTTWIETVRTQILEPEKITFSAQALEALF